MVERTTACEEAMDAGHRPTPPARRRRRAALAALVGLVLLAPTPSLADHDQEAHFEVVAPPRPKEPVLDRLIPGLPEFRRDLTPFLRDTDLKLHLRSFYFNREKSDGSYSEAWALGGWLQYQSGWLLDTFAMGGTFYTSLPAYAPDTRPGSLLLNPNQDAINTLGEAWGALRYKEYALLKGYRQRIDDGYVNPQDNRMVPNTFEAVTLSGQVGWAYYDVGYVWRMKPRDSNDFISMSSQAGAPGDSEGLILTSIKLTPIKDLVIYGGNFYVPDVFNTAFGKAEYLIPLAKDLGLQFGVQFTDQRSVGDDRIGDFSTWNFGAGARLLWRGLTLGVATHFTGDDASINSRLRVLARLPLARDHRLQPGRREGLRDRPQVRLRRHAPALPGPRAQRAPALRPGQRPGEPRDGRGSADDPGGRFRPHLQRALPQAAPVPFPRDVRGPGRPQVGQGLPDHHQLRVRPALTQ